MQLEKNVTVDLQRSKPVSHLTGYEVVASKADLSLAYNHFLFEISFLFSIFWECQWTAGHMSE